MERNEFTMIRSGNILTTTRRKVLRVYECALSSGRMCEMVKTKSIFTAEPHLQTFVDMYYRGEDFDKITQEKLEKRLPEGPAMRLFNAIQELIRSKNERGHIIYLYLMP